MNSEQKKIINRIIKEFNFSKVRNVMQHLDWKWAFSKSKNRIPTIAEMKNVARHLLERAANDSKLSSYNACGGFEANKEDDYWFSLTFVVTEWSESGEDEFDKLDKEVDEKYSSAIGSLDL